MIFTDYLLYAVAAAMYSPVIAAVVAIMALAASEYWGCFKPFLTSALARARVRLTRK